MNFDLPNEQTPEQVRETFLYMTLRSLMMFVATEMEIPRETAEIILGAQDTIWESLGGKVGEGWDD